MHKELASRLLLLLESHQCCPVRDECARTRLYNVLAQIHKNKAMAVRLNNAAAEQYAEYCSPLKKKSESLIALLGRNFERIEEYAQENRVTLPAELDGLGVKVNSFRAYHDCKIINSESNIYGLIQAYTGSLALLADGHRSFVSQFACISDEGGITSLSVSSQIAEWMELWDLFERGKTATYWYAWQKVVPCADFLHDFSSFMEYVYAEGVGRDQIEQLSFYAAVVLVEMRNFV